MESPSSGTPGSAPTRRSTLLALFFEISQADMAWGGIWSGVPIRYEGQALTVDHVDVQLIPAHPGFEEPHYGIHLLVVSRADREAIRC
jgi:hypothetical protein